MLRSWPTSGAPDGTRCGSAGPYRTTSSPRPSTPRTRRWSASCPRKTARPEPFRVYRRELNLAAFFMMVTVTGEYLPAIPASAGALIFDRADRLLILKPTYKSGWTIPGGVMEADGETPWEACRREVREECGLEVRRARLACMDFRRPKPGRAGGIRFLFDCGRIDDQVMAGI